MATPQPTLAATPRRALIELDERRQRMFRQAEGRVLDLTEHTSFAVADLAAAGEEFDTIVSVLQISVAPDAAALCRSLASMLTSEGRLLFLEPTAVVGFAGAVQHTFGPLLRRTTGRRHDLDVPALIRAAGLSIGDCERISMRALWPYRSFVQGAAHLPFVRRDG